MNFYHRAMNILKMSSLDETWCSNVLYGHQGCVQECDETSTTSTTGIRGVEQNSLGSN